MHIRKLLGLALLLISVMPRLASGQVNRGIPSDGRDFYLTYVGNTYTCSTDLAYRSAFILVCSYYDCNVTISYFDHDKGTEIKNAAKHVLAKQKLQVPIDLSMAINHDPNNAGALANPNGEVAEYTAIHIHADHPISV